MATVTKAFQIPAGTAPGVYWIIAQANATNAVSEVDAPTRANNTKATTVPIVIGPDLLVTAAAATPVTVAPGFALSLTNTVKNQGGAAAGAFDVGVYLSTNGTFDAGTDPRLARRVAGLAPAAGLDRHDIGHHSEQRLGGNVFPHRARRRHGRWRARGRRGQRDEQRVGHGGDSDRATGPGRAIGDGAGDGQGRNERERHPRHQEPGPGGGRARPDFPAPYLSNDPTLDTPGDVVLGDMTVGPLRAGAMATETGTVPIPPATQPGLYWVIAQANVSGIVPEGDSPTRANNVRATAVPIIVGPDLLVTAAAATPTSVAPGSSVSVTNTIKNQGAALAGAFDVGIYLSTNSTFDPERMFCSPAGGWPG